MNPSEALFSDSRDIGSARSLMISGTSVLLAAFLVGRGVDSRAGGEAHILLDVLAPSWALVAGALGLVRYYGLKTRPVLFAGIAFLGASVLDGCHALAALRPLSGRLQGEILPLAESSWVASRIFFGCFLALCASSRLLSPPCKRGEQALFLFAGILLAASFLPFLPFQRLGAQEAGTLLPVRLLPALVFLCGFTALLRKGAWRSDPFEQSLILASLLGFFESLLFMGASGRGDDSEFVLPHVLKSAGYLVVLAALMYDLLRVFGEAAKRDDEARKRTAALEESRAEAMQALAFAHRAKLEAQAAERRFRDVLEWALDPMIIVDGGGTVTLVNKAAESLFGYGERELVGRPIEVLIPESVRGAYARHRAHFVAMPAVRSTGAGMELPARRKDGSLVPVEVRLKPVETPGGTLVSTVIHDLTERKEAEAEIARYTRELERSNAELEQFAYVASHDLQEPLRMVSSFTQLLARRCRGKLDETAHEYIDQAVDGARRMQDLIRDLLKYSRVKTKEGAFECVACEDVFSVVLRNLRVAIEESRATVTREALPIVNADATQLGQLLQNLIANAIKFRAVEPPRVHVGAAREDGHWVFSVRDNGIGLDPEHVGRAFEIFKRFHRREGYPGTGIGLAICKRIVERHGGKIWLDSRPGKGTVAYFSLPLTTDV